MRLVMMGTGDFALPAFLSLYDSDYDVVGLFTQPDRTGRGHHRHQNPMKDAAVERGTPVFQPQRVNEREPLDELRSLEPDVCVVAAYGQILSAELLEIPSRCAINLHASILPKYRGAAPIQYAVLNGETATGVSIFRIEPRLDAGPVLGVVKTAIGPHETAGHVQTRLSELTVPLLARVLEQIEARVVREELQDKLLVTRAPRLKKSDGLIDWSRTVHGVDCHIRAMQPWPNPFTFLHQTDGTSSAGRSSRMLVLEVRRSDAVPEDVKTAVPGEVVQVDSRRIVVQTGDALVEIIRLRPEGKRDMTAAEFLCGHAVHVGDRFGRE